MTHRVRSSSVVLSLVLASVTGVAFAQTAATMPATRNEVKMDRDEFLKTHTFDPLGDGWMLKKEFEPPKGVKTRAEVKAMSDDFMRNNRFDTLTTKWVPLGKSPRDMGKMSREEIRQETEYFTRTHYYDQLTEKWVDKPSSK